ncbi:hypothetical protein I7I50_09643 [Histoplasma capsulatum G186AR]|uniref:JmjC domain-containing protein n=1 Tax=Ajellomyces capsulatus TaxID=5037 RepID=A0A8H7YUP7_AJECA|nr:hypothetical protein I7I52_07173 [Histoplasma capsulatum]QSS74455.1 hypothetical protein I7I50_09643 [Histoplasma capsulatum G186AR]
MAPPRKQCTLCEKTIRSKDYSNHVKNQCLGKSLAITCENCNKTVPQNHECVRGKRQRCQLCQKLKDAKHMKRHIKFCQHKQNTSAIPDLLDNDDISLSTVHKMISSLQNDGKFPECQLDNLLPLTDSENVCWKQPSLLSPSDVWIKQFSPLEIFNTVRLATQTLSKNSIYRDGELIQNEEQNWNISNVFYQAGIPLSSSDLSPKYSLMNISLPKEFHQLQPCNALKNQLRIMDDNNLELLANFAPAGNFVDIHIDQNRHGLSQSIGHSQRIWLLYPPTEENLKVFAQFSGEFGRLTKISSKLSDGYVACVDSSRVVYIPPGWLHATFTTRSGSLVGVNFVSLESLETMALSVGIHLPYLYRISQSVLEDFREFSKAILSFLDNEYEAEIITLVLRSWVLFLQALSTDVLKDMNFQSAMLTLLNGLETELSGKKAYCCDTAYTNVLFHVKCNHWVKFHKNAL